MKKVLLLLAVLFFCGQIAAQEVRKDSINILEKSSTEAVKATLDSLFWLHLLVSTMESNYDFVCDYILPDSFIAYRNCEYLQVNVWTGEERVSVTREKYEKYGILPKERE
jgi:hypothetical protein